MGKRSDKCPICCLGEQGLEGKLLLEKIDFMLTSNVRANKIVEMCQNEHNFIISVRQLQTHKRYHLLEEIKKVEVEFEEGSVLPQFEPEIRVDDQEEMIQDLIREYAQSIQRQIAIALLTKSIKDEATLSSSINNLLNTISKCGFTIVNMDEFNDKVTEIKEYLA